MPQDFQWMYRRRNPITQIPTLSLTQSALRGLAAYGVIGQNTTLPTFDSGYLKNLLLKELDKPLANPYASEWREAGRKAISSQTRQALEFLKQQSAISGFRGFVDPNVVQRIYEQGSIASQQIERDIQTTSLDLMKTQLAMRDSAISKLLGLEQAKAQFENQQGFGLMGLLTQVREGQMDRDLQWRITQEQIRQQELSGLGQFFGGLLQGGVTGWVYSLLSGNRNSSGNN